MVQTNLGEQTVVGHIRRKNWRKGGLVYDIDLGVKEHAVSGSDRDWMIDHLHSDNVYVERAGRRIQTRTVYHEAVSDGTIFGINISLLEVLQKQLTGD